MQPLAARMAPSTLEEYVGQTHLLAPGKPLYQAIQQDRLHSMILWGPPGSGKTSLAKLIAHLTRAHFQGLSAVMVGVKEVRAAVEAAQQRLQHKQRTILFIDEVHRFNKAQQDAFLPFVEDGTIILIGATTENPSFELNHALLSRARVYLLKSLTQEELLLVLSRALHDKVKGLGQLHLRIDDDLRQTLIAAADGDARRLLGLLEVLADLAPKENTVVTEAMLHEVLAQSYRHFDKRGEQFYDQISALHKSVRGSDPDAALYWLCRMLDGGCDPLYVARRVVRMANEDIGNADPRGLTLALQAWDVQERLGSPEGELALAQAVIYLACAAKSNAVYNAFKQAMHDVKQEPSYAVPLHLRNAPTRLMKDFGYGKDYRYAHDEPEGFAAGERYFPDERTASHYYHPIERGLEIEISKKLAYLRGLQENKSA